LGGEEESTVFGRGRKVPASHAAMANSVMAAAAAYDPAFPIIDGKRFLIHMSATTIPVAFAVAEKRKAGGKELLTLSFWGRPDCPDRCGLQQTPAYGWDREYHVILRRCRDCGKVIGFDRR